MTNLENFAYFLHQRMAEQLQLAAKQTDRPDDGRIRSEVTLSLGAFEWGATASGTSIDDLIAFFIDRAELTITQLRRRYGSNPTSDCYASVLTNVDGHRIEGAWIANGNRIKRACARDRAAAALAEPLPLADHPDDCPCARCAHCSECPGDSTCVCKCGPCCGA